MRTIDINSDLGESFGNWRMGDDESLIPHITAANVACGFHGGDPITMLKTVETCKRHGVAVGAHPGFPDLLGFGRRVMQLSPDDAYAYVVYQAGALQAACAVHGVALHHVKPHGAFYSFLRDDAACAEAAARAIADVMPEPVLYWPPPRDGALARAAEKAGVRVVHEAYVDLEYSPEGNVILERQKTPKDPARIREKVRRWLEDGEMPAADGTPLRIDAESVCVHGDGPNVLEVVAAVRAAAEECGFGVAPLPLEPAARA